MKTKGKLRMTVEADWALGLDWSEIWKGKKGIGRIASVAAALGQLAHAIGGCFF